MLIGICGKAGAGKDTIGDYIVENYSFKKIALADPIKRMVKDVFVLDDYAVYDRDAREKELEKWPGWSVRRLLQIIGTELFRNNIDDSVWVKSLFYRIQEDIGSNYIVTDVRFPNELEFLKENSKEGEFYCIKVIRPGFDGNVGIHGHASEAYDLKADIEIINDETIENLYNKVRNVMEGFKS